MSVAFRAGPRAEHLVRGQSGLAGEVAKLRADVAAAFTLAESMGIQVARFVGVSVNSTDADGIKTAFASAAAPVTLTGTDFDGALVYDEVAIINSPKRVTLTVAGSGTPADWLGGDVVITGTDSDGDVLVEEVTSAAGAGTTTTLGYFATVTQVELPIATATGASLTLGVVTDAAAICDFASDTAELLIDGTVPGDWNRDRIGNRALAYPRRISFVFSSHANWDATTIVVRGRDALGVQISSNILIANGGGTTVTTDKFFSSIERITVPAQSGTNGTCTVGPENTMVGFAIDPLNNAEAVTVIREVSRANAAGSWAAPTAGAVDDNTVTNMAPYGSYTPHSSVLFDGIREYIVAYIPKSAI